MTYTPAPIRKGSAFPTSPASDDLFYRTDLDMWFSYDGTRWLCNCPHTLSNRFGPQSATASDVARFTNPKDGSIYITKWDAAGFVLTGNDSTKYWTMNINTYDGSSFASIGSSGSMQNLGIGWVNLTTVTMNVVVASTIRWYTVGITKTSTPGDLEGEILVTYRNIAT